MVKKEDDVKSEQNNASEVDPQKKYLMDQFGSLMDQVGDGFGGPLQEELIRRLEQTIADFHQEVNEMLTNLKESSEKRHEKLKEIWENPDAHDNDNKLSDSDIETEASDDDKGETTELSDWEKRLEALDSKSKKEVDKTPSEKNLQKERFLWEKEKVKRNLRVKYLSSIYIYILLVLNQSNALSQVQQKNVEEFSPLKKESTVIPSLILLLQRESLMNQFVL